MNKKEFDLVNKLIVAHVMSHDAWVSMLQVENMKKQNQIPVQQADFALNNIKKKEESLKKEIQDIERQLVTG